MANWYVSSVGYTAVTAWSSGSVRALNSYTRPTAPASGSERVFKATSVSGTHTTGGVEPTWPLGAGATVTDNAGANQIIWTEVTGSEANQASNAWAAPAARVTNIWNSGVSHAADGDTIFVSQDHAETLGSTLAFVPGATSVAFNVICVNRGVGSSVPPVTADLATTATVSTTGAIDIQFNQANVTLYIRGIKFQAGNSSNAGSITFGFASGTNGSYTLDNCQLIINNTASSARINMGTVGACSGTVRLLNTSMTFGATGQAINMGLAQLEWRNTASAIAGTAPTTLFANASAAGGGPITIRGVDLSGVTGNLFSNVPNGQVPITIANCQLGSGVVIASGAPPMVKGVLGGIRVENCDDSGNGRNYRLAWIVAGGSAVQDATVVRTGGASDGVTPISHKITTAAAVSLAAPMVLPAIGKRFNSTGSAATATIYFVANAASALTNAQIWAEIEALTTSSLPLSTLTDNRVANVLATTTTTAHSTDTSAWDSAATARQNNHAYSVNDVFQVTGSNAGRIFIVTTAGTSATSEPAAYGTAVDGDQITTDRNGGGMVVRCMVRQKMTVGFTPRVKGEVFATLKAAVASQIVYVDPLLTITVP